MIGLLISQCCHCFNQFKDSSFFPDTHTEASAQNTTNNADLSSPTSTFSVKHLNGGLDPDRHPHCNVSLHWAKLPPPPWSMGADHYPRPSTSSGRELGSYHCRLFGWALRHPPWVEGMLRNNYSILIQDLENNWKIKRTPTHTAHIITRNNDK